MLSVSLSSRIPPFPCIKSYGMGKGEVRVAGSAIVEVVILAAAAGSFLNGGYLEPQVFDLSFGSSPKTLSFSCWLLPPLLDI